MIRGWCVVIGSSRFWSELELNRLVYIGGTYGSGKTLLSVAIAEHWFRRGYRVIANFPCVFNSDITPDLLDSLKRVCIVLDEAGARLLDARSWNSADSKMLLSVMDYCRKQELFFILPSATTVDKRARKLAIARNLRASRALDAVGLGRLLWMYVGIPSQDDRFSFPLFAPYAYFGCYDTTAIPGVYQDALALLLYRFQERVAVDREASAAAAARMEAVLESGRSIPGLRLGPWSFEGES